MPIFLDFNRVKCNYWGDAASLRPYLFTPLLPIGLFENAAPIILSTHKRCRWPLFAVDAGKTLPSPELFIRWLQLACKTDMQFNNGIDVGIIV